jgi:probable rRNA maturation factor
MMIRFNYADRKLNGVNKTSLKEMVATIFKQEKIQYIKIDYIFCSDEYLIQINRASLNHDYYTDIITFPFSSKNQPVEAEIYISIDRVKENTSTHTTSFKEELARVIAHGALHLCGYKDKTKKDIDEMRAKEDVYINGI